MKISFNRILLSTLFFLFIGLAMAASSEDTKKYEQPILISSAGQSADVKLAGMLASKLKLNANVINMAQVSDLKDVKSLIIVPGFSSKGLGAAGISQKDEMDRVVALVNAATEQNIPIIMMHIGGNARRKGQSDQFNKLVAEASKQMIVVEQGNEDEFFSNIAKEKNIPLTLVDKIVAASEPLGALFK
ncbi:MAG: DUF6305 family protein [Candidatus Zixiibacteriota bacterium]